MAKKSFDKSAGVVVAPREKKVYNRKGMTTKERFAHYKMLEMRYGYWVRMNDVQLGDEAQALLPGIEIVESTRDELIKMLVLNHVEQMAK